MTALTADELLAWLERTSGGWRTLLAEHPEALDFPCDVREAQRVGDLMQHVVAVELRYAVSQMVRKSSKATIKAIVAMLKIPVTAFAF